MKSVNPSSGGRSGERFLPPIPTSFRDIQRYNPAVIAPAPHLDRGHDIRLLAVFERFARKLQQEMHAGDPHLRGFLLPMWPATEGSAQEVSFAAVWGTSVRAPRPEQALIQSYFTMRERQAARKNRHTLVRPTLNAQGFIGQLAATEGGTIDARIAYHPHTDETAEAFRAHATEDIMAQPWGPERLAHAAMQEVVLAPDSLLRFHAGVRYNPSTRDLTTVYLQGDQSHLIDGLRQL